VGLRRSRHSGDDAAGVPASSGKTGQRGQPGELRWEEGSYIPRLVWVDEGRRCGLTVRGALGNGGRRWWRARSGEGDDRVRSEEGLRGTLSHEGLSSREILHVQESITQA